MHTHKQREGFCGRVQVITSASGYFYTNTSIASLAHSHTLPHFSFPSINYLSSWSKSCSSLLFILPIRPWQFEPLCFSTKKNHSQPIKHSKCSCTIYYVFRCLVCQQWPNCALDVVSIFFRLSNGRSVNSFDLRSLLLPENLLGLVERRLVGRLDGSNVLDQGQEADLRSVCANFCEWHTPEPVGDMLYHEARDRGLQVLL